MISHVHTQQNGAAECKNHPPTLDTAHTKMLSPPVHKPNLSGAILVARYLRNETCNINCFETISPVVSV